MFVILGIVMVGLYLSPWKEVAEKYKKIDSYQSDNVENTAIDSNKYNNQSLVKDEPKEDKNTTDDSISHVTLAPEIEKLSWEEILQSDPFVMDLDLRENSFLNPDHVHDDNYKQEICANLDLMFERYKKDPQHESKRAMLKFSIDCQNYLGNSDIGPADWLVSIYGMRFAALTHGKNVDIYMECDKFIEENKQKTESVLPWAMGYFPALSQDDLETQSFPPFDKACVNYDKSPLAYMIPFIQFELRRMAIAIAGIPRDDHPSAIFAKKYLWSSHGGFEKGIYQIPNPKEDDSPLVPNLELDDVAIQFTCGYYLGGKSHSDFGFFKWKSYKHRISPDARSIGIITNSYVDSKTCKPFIDDLVNYLKESFPNIRITVRHGEAITTAFTRMIMANQTFAGLTSFGALPVAATFGTGYMVKPKEKNVKNKWMILASEMHDNIELMDENERMGYFSMKSRMIGNHGEADAILYYLREDDATWNDPYPPETTFILDDIIIKNADLPFNSYWEGDAAICKNMDHLSEIVETENLKKGILNFTIGCQQYFKESPLGTGNWISAFYGLRLAALTHGNIDINMACFDALEEKTNLILPWLMGKWPARKPEQPFPWPHPDSEIKPWGLPSMKLACGNYDTCPIGYMTPFMRYELQRMAIAIAGIPNDSHPSAEFAKKYLWSDKNGSKDVYQIPDPQPGDAPLVPGIELDDTAIHFRCGDIMGHTNHPSFGFMKFTAYKKWVSPEAKTIGIVTGPFEDDSQNRKSRVNSNCKPVVLELKKYLEEHFPSATVKIRNDGDETITTAYARLIMANQTFASITSFGVFPVVATFGTGYIKKPDFPKVPNKWIPLTSEMYDDIIMMDEREVLMAGTTLGWLRQPNGMERVIYWFKTEDFKATDPYPPQR